MKDLFVAVKDYYLEPYELKSDRFLYEPSAVYDKPSSDWHPYLSVKGK